VRVLFLSADDEFASVMQLPVYARMPEIPVGCVVSTCKVYKMSDLQAAAFLLKQSGSYFVWQMLKMKIFRRLLVSENINKPSKLATSHGYPLHRTTNVNSSTSLDFLRKQKPDILVSTNFNQYIGRHVREIPTLGTWNIHKAFLPQYRGMAPSFHALLEGSESAGVTLHVVEKGFDVGPIIGQQRIPVEENDTVHSLNRKASEAGGALLTQALETVLKAGRIQTRPQPPGDWQQYTYPSHSEVTRFRRMGLLFDRLR